MLCRRIVAIGILGWGALAAGACAARGKAPQSTTPSNAPPEAAPAAPAGQPGYQQAPIGGETAPSSGADALKKPEDEK